MILSVKGMNVYYGKVAALRDVSFEIPEGAIVTLIGSNGAGKSTILKAISGLVRSVSGEIVFAGKRIDRLLTQDIVRLGIGHVPEGRRLFPTMSVMENLAMGAYLRTRGMRVDKDLEQVFEYFPILKKRRTQRAGSLSGGEQQMLAIGRALMSSPKLLLLDEPSIGLSPLMSQTIGTIVQTINEEGVSILLVEQNARMALKVADVGYVLETGNLVLQGDAEALMRDEAVKKAYLGM